MFSVVSVILFSGDPVQSSGSPPIQGTGPTLQTLSHLVNLDLTLQGPPRDMFIPFQYEVQTVGERLVSIQLTRLLVFNVMAWFI